MIFDHLILISYFGFPPLLNHSVNTNETKCASTSARRQTVSAWNKSSRKPHRCPPKPSETETSSTKATSSNWQNRDRGNRRSAPCSTHRFRNREMLQIQKRFPRGRGRVHISGIETDEIHARNKKNEHNLPSHIPKNHNVCAVYPFRTSPATRSRFSQAQTGSSAHTGAHIFRFLSESPQRPRRTLRAPNSWAETAT